MSNVGSAHADEDRAATDRLSQGEMDRVGHKTGKPQPGSQPKSSTLMEKTC